MSWNEVPQIEQNGIITNYEILFEPQNTFEGTLMSASLNTTNTSVSLRGLQEYVLYDIQVRAYTAIGPGPYSELVSRRTFEDCKRQC